MTYLTVTDELLKEMTNLIVQEINPLKVVLFGSHARGVARPDSDLDFLVVEDGPFNAHRSRRAEMARLWKLLGDYFIAKDFLIYSPEEISRYQWMETHVVHHALKDGKVLYERT